MEEVEEIAQDEVRAKYVTPMEVLRRYIAHTEMMLFSQTIRWIIFSILTFVVGFICGMKQ